MIKYGIIPEEQITQEIAAIFDVVSNSSFNYVLTSSEITDGSGQVSTIKTSWITFKFVEYQEGNTIAEICLDDMKNDFNLSHTLQIDFPVMGDVNWARNLPNEKN